MATSDFDLDAMASKLSATLQNYGVGSAELQTAVREAANSMVQTQAADTTQAQTQDIIERTHAYHQLTDLIGQMNEAYNANNYAGGMLKKEGDRVSRLNAQAQNEVYKAQQKYLMVAYKRQHYRFLTGVLLFTAAFTMVLAIVTAFWRQGLIAGSLFGTILVVLCVVFTLALIVMFTSNARRRQYHWRQFYWSVSDAVRNGKGSGSGDGSCPSA